MLNCPSIALWFILNQLPKWCAYCHVFFNETSNFPWLVFLCPSSAHWYLAIICFPGLEKAHVEPNPLYQPQTQAHSTAVSSSPPTDGGPDELDDVRQHTAVPHRSAADVNRQRQYTGEHVSHTSEWMQTAAVSLLDFRLVFIPDGLHRIIECYGTDDSHHSDDQSSCQVSRLSLANLWYQSSLLLI